MSSGQESVTEQDFFSLWPNRIRGYLNEHIPAYQVHAHARAQTLQESAQLINANYEYVMRAVVLEDVHGYVMAILPANRMLDFSALSKQFSRDLVPVPQEALREIFKECEAMSYPPLPELYQLEAYVDASLFELPKVYFEPGSHEVMIELSQEAFKTLYDGYRQGDFSAQIQQLAEPVPYLENFEKYIYKFTPQNLAHHDISQDLELPVMPRLGNDLLALLVSPEQNPKKLIGLISADIQYAKSFIRWAELPYFNHGPGVDSVDQALEILGYDIALALMLGVVLTKSMTVPFEGPLGKKEYWRFALYTAILVDKLYKVMPYDKRPARNLAFLTGFLHNFGHLILGEVFPTEFYVLNRYVAANPQVSLAQIERHVLGVQHEQIGAWLMQAWNMPQGVIAGVKWHHQGEFLHDQRVYSNLVLVAIRFLYRLQVGDAKTTKIPDTILETLGMTYDQAKQAYDEFVTRRDDLDVLMGYLMF